MIRSLHRILVLGTVAPAWAEVMTLTFVRHAQSEANAANVLDGFEEA